MNKPPVPDSPMEILYILLWKMRQNIELNKTRAITQALVLAVEDGKPAVEAYKDYVNAMMPFAKNVDKLEEQTLKDKMYAEIAKGPLSVVPMARERVKGIGTKLDRGKIEMEKRATLLKQGILRKIDDPFVKRIRK